MAVATLACPLATETIFVGFASLTRAASATVKSTSSILTDHPAIETIEIASTLTTRLASPSTPSDSGITTISFATCPPRDTVLIGLAILTNFADLLLVCPCAVATLPAILICGASEYVFSLVTFAISTAFEGIIAVSVYFTLALAIRRSHILTDPFAGPRIEIARGIIKDTTLVFALALMFVFAFDGGIGIDFATANRRCH